MRVGVVGAGIIGLSCAFELVRAGHDVRVFDPDPGRGATCAAAGMLAPAGEAWHGESELLRCGTRSAALWPEFARRLERASGRDVDLRRQGTLAVGYDHDDLRTVLRSVDILQAGGLAYEVVDRRSARAIEPTLGRVAGGLWLPDDHHVDPRLVVKALLAVLGDRVIHLRARPGHHGVEVSDGSIVECDVVVVATGVDARDLRAVIRPVTGETIRVRTEDPPTHVVRARVQGEPVYVVPRSGGEVVIGASEEEHGGEATASVGAVVRLLHAARAIIPTLERAAVLDVTARHRPGTPDNLPLVGPVDSPGRARLILAAGHYRGGVLLAPLTAQIVRRYVERDGHQDAHFAADLEAARLEAALHPDRFAHHHKEVAHR